MRTLVLSDIHLEFGPFELPDDIGEFDVAVFAGDVDRPIGSAMAWLERQRRGRLQLRPVVFVPGNHEFYGTEILLSLAEASGLAKAPGIHLLAPGTCVIDGTRFIGATLWTDYRLLGDPRSARQAAQDRMNDHRRIKIAEGGRRIPFRPIHALSMHHQDLAYITNALGRPFSGPTVVVTHHAPHRNSVQPQYQGDRLSPAFASDLGEFIDRFRPELWIHGHDHGSQDYLVGTPRIVSNQAGYPGQRRATRGRVAPARTGGSTQGSSCPWLDQKTEWIRG
ncbi:metallophosphoesterase [Bosea beijingensis]